MTLDRWHGPSEAYWKGVEQAWLLLCSRPGRAAPPVVSLTGRASSAQTGLQGRLEHWKCYIICCIEYIIMANAIRRKRRTSMDKSELEAMPLDDLWALHEQLTASYPNGLSRRSASSKTGWSNSIAEKLCRRRPRPR